MRRVLPKQEAYSSHITEWEAFISEEVEECISEVEASFSIVRHLLPDGAIFLDGSYRLALSQLTTCTSVRLVALMCPVTNS